MRCPTTTGARGGPGGWLPLPAAAAACKDLVQCGWSWVAAGTTGIKPTYGALAFCLGVNKLTWAHRWTFTVVWAGKPDPGALPGVCEMRAVGPCDHKSIFSTSFCHATDQGVLCWRAGTDVVAELGRECVFLHRCAASVQQLNFEADSLLLVVWQQASTTNSSRPLRVDLAFLAPEPENPGNACTHSASASFP
jgi:hypothetical protein